jgi:cobalamin biosynthesis protein CobD/CbiB
MVSQMIRQWAGKLLEALRRAAARSTTLDEILFGAILGLVLILILTFLGVFD